MILLDNKEKIGKLIFKFNCHLEIVKGGLQKKEYIPGKILFSSFFFNENKIMEIFNKVLTQIFSSFLDILGLMFF